MLKIINHNKVWTKEEDDFIRNNNNLSTQQLMDALCRSYESISTRKKNLHIKQDVHDYIADFSANTKESAYSLGFIFADGHVFYSPKNSYGGVAINILSTDALFLDKPLLKTSMWHTRTFIRAGTKKPQKSYRIGSNDLYNFLYNDLDFKYKNQFFSQKIFDFLPEHLHRYFWRGYFDGDGCIYIPETKSQNGIRCYIAGSHGFDWSFLQDHLTKMKIESKIKLQTNHTGGWSHIHIDKLLHCEKFINYIYGGVGVDGIGFTRKYIKYIRYLERRYCLPKSKYSNSKNFPKMFFNIKGV